jgi:hypothetical protein
MKDHARTRIFAEAPAAPVTFVSCGPALRTAIFVTALALGVGCDDDHPVTGDAAAMDARPSDGALPGDVRPDAAVDAVTDARPDAGDAGDAGLPVDVPAGTDAAVDGAADAGDAGGKPDVADASGETGGSAEVWPADAIKLVAEDRGGGFAPSPPAGSACQYSGTYTWTVATKNLAWQLCQATSPGAPYLPVTEARILTDSERDALVAALDKVAVTTAPSCGADKNVLALKVTTAAGEKQYLDNFYQCQKQGVYVTNIDGVFQVLRTLSK